MHGLGIQHDAGRLAQHLRVKEFQLSAKWIWWFRKHYGTVSHASFGEFLNANVEALALFVNQLLKLWEERHLHKFQIYNADETGLYWHTFYAISSAL